MSVAALHNSRHLRLFDVVWLQDHSPVPHNSLVANPLRESRFVVAGPCACHRRELQLHTIQISFFSKSDLASPGAHASAHACMHGCMDRCARARMHIRCVHACLPEQSHKRVHSDQADPAHARARKMHACVCAQAASASAAEQCCGIASGMRSGMRTCPHWPGMFEGDGEATALTMAVSYHDQISSRNVINASRSRMCGCACLLR